MEPQTSDNIFFTFVWNIFAPIKIDTLALDMGSKRMWAFMCSYLLFSECNSKLNLSTNFNKTLNFIFHVNPFNSSQIATYMRLDRHGEDTHYSQISL
jgi:hypothetical protein